MTDKGGRTGGRESSPKAGKLGTSVGPSDSASSAFAMGSSESRLHGGGSGGSALKAFHTRPEPETKSGRFADSSVHRLESAPVGSGSRPAAMDVLDPESRDGSSPPSPTVPMSVTGNMGTGDEVAFGRHPVLRELMRSFLVLKRRNTLLSSALRFRSERIRKLEGQLDAARRKVDELDEDLAIARGRALRLEEELDSSRIATLELAAIKRSFTWRALSPVRRLIDAQYLRSTRRLILSSGLFDIAWYVRQNADVGASAEDPVYHYLRHGCSEGRDPNPLFDGRWYLAENPDVRYSGINPLVHYIKHGTREGRDPNPLFDTDWYLDQYLSSDRPKRSPLADYLDRGAFEGRNPNPFFDSAWYLNEYPEAAEAGANPLVHYVQRGASAGHDPGPSFDGERYLKNNPDVLETGMNPLEHYLRYGSSEGRRSWPRSNYEEWIRLHDLVTDADISEMRRLSASFENRPLMSILMPVYNTEEQLLREAIESVISQSYDNWELCIADDCSDAEHVRAVLTEFERSDRRIKVVYRSENGHISRATNSALRLASGDWIVLLDHDDILAPDALFCVAELVNRRPDVQMIYSDEDKIGVDGRRYDPYFKSDWNHDLFLSHNMFSHLGVYKRDLVVAVDGLRAGFEGAQDYDLALRCMERISDGRIHHIPHVLYHWRVLPGSTALSTDEKPYAMLAGERALREHLRRCSMAATVEYVGIGYRVRYSLPDVLPKVTLIIPTRNKVALLERCVASILKLTDYDNYDIIIIDNGSNEPATLEYLDRLRLDPKIEVIRDGRPFNYSALNNAGVAAASGSIIGLLNNDLEVISPDWLGEMVSLALQPGVGAVGAKLIYPDNSIQHAGVVLGMGGIADHAHKGLDRDCTGYLCRAALLQSFSAVTAACLVVQKDRYAEVGGLNEADLPVAFNDVDFCLKLLAAGYRNVWTPYAELYHHESASRGKEDSVEKRTRAAAEMSYMAACWGGLIKADPAYNPNLSLWQHDFSVSFPPRALKPWKRMVADAREEGAVNGATE
jgi:glycosyltransferase involved in cell wall biosynthesis